MYNVRKNLLFFTNIYNQCHTISIIKTNSDLKIYSTTLSRIFDECGFSTLGLLNRLCFFCLSSSLFYTVYFGIMIVFRTRLTMMTIWIVLVFVVVVVSMVIYLSSNHIFHPLIDIILLHSQMMHFRIHPQHLLPYLL
jgi:hypothetical protein